MMRLAIVLSVFFVQDAPSGKIAFESRRGGQDVYLMNADGTDVKWLAKGGAPSMSADGTKLLYAAYFNKTASFDLLLVHTDGSSTQRLTKTEEMEQCAALSPDGAAVVYCVSEIRNKVDTSVIWVMNIDGTGKRKVAEGETPAWSPDGSKIVFAAIRGNASHSDIYVIDRDGTNERQVTRNKRPNRWPDWSPDGSRIAYASHFGKDRKWEICVIDVDGSDEARLTDAVDDDTDPAWSPDGKRIAFCSGRQREMKQEIFVMDADGSNPTNLTNHESYDMAPVWSR